jgi:hypothetical protein
VAVGDGRDVGAFARDKEACGARWEVLPHAVRDLCPVCVAGVIAGGRFVDVVYGAMRCRHSDPAILCHHGFVSLDTAVDGALRAGTHASIC